ncbi:MAG: sulfite exporter TauE/SafE family protein [Nocardioidaceae bacterium]|nr:sulfite exporter TauE/SafE family protein [Nocardioidaceae bacterium]
MTAAGAGSLVSFPLLVAAGLPPLVANTSTNVGLVPGGLAGSFGFRRELAEHPALVTRVAVTSAAGALAGGVLLLVLPASSFDVVVPYLVLVAATLVGLGPLISRALTRRALRRGIEPGPDRVSMGPRLTGASTVVGVYGGYFGAAQGVLLVALLALTLDVPLTTVNGLKSIAIVSANLAATVVFVLFAPLDWAAVGLIAVGSVTGAWLGAHVGRRLPPSVFRALVVVFGWVVGVRLLLT